jgi:uncharacterized membrane protein YfhO
MLERAHMKPKINFKVVFHKFLMSRNENLVYLLSFFVPVFVMFGLYISRGIYPFGDSAYLVRDMYHQYAPFFLEFANKMKSGESLTYSNIIGMGINFTALYAYYLASPTNWLLALLPAKSMIEIMNAFIIIKIGLCGLSFSHYISRHFNHKDISAAVFSLFYALSSYMAAYSWNIMWLDCLVLLPIIVLGLERLVQNPSLKSGFLYGISLSIAIFSNYYIGIMLCIFSVLYFFYLLFTTDTLNDALSYLRKMWHFAVFSIISGGISACLLLPEYFALKMSGSGDLNFPDTMERYFSVFQMISRLLMNIPVSTGLTHEPNIYSTVAIFLLFPLYLFHPRVRRREKAGKTFLIFLFLLSFSFNIPDFIWHGFHFPNSLPARQSFIFIFLLLEMSYEAFQGIKIYSDKQLFGSFAGTVILFLLFDHFIAGEEYSYGIIYLSMTFVALYLFVFAFYRKHSIRTMGTMISLLLLFLLAITETVINTGSTGIETVNRTNYTSDNRSLETLVGQVKAADTSYYRIEKYERRTKNDAAWNQYPGVSIFSSTTNAPLNDYLDSLGFQSSMNAYSFSGHTPLTASLLSVKYMLSNVLLDSSENTELYSQIDGKYLYRNNFTLPAGFMLEAEFEDTWDNDFSNPFVVQNNFITAVIKTTGLPTDDLGVEGDLFEPLDFDNSGKVATIPVTSEDELYLYTTTNDLTSLEVTIKSPNGETISTKSINDLKHKYIVSLGSAEPGSSIQVTTKDDVDSIHFYVYRYQEALFKAVYNELSKQPFVIDTYEDTYVKGSIQVEKDGILYTSIPYENGWSAFVDGVETEIVPFKDALLAIPMSQGDHRVELFYSPQGLKTGTILSVISFLLFIALIIYYSKENKQSIKHEDSLHENTK